MNLGDKIEVLKSSNDKELCEAVAERWLASLKKINPDALYTAALSGGKIATPFFAAVASAARQQRISLRGVDFFWADERCVPPGDAESNFRIAREHLFDPLQIPEPRVHRVRGELDPEEASRLAEAELRRVTEYPSPEPPVLDIIFLGMGEDGHTASIFPGDNTSDARSPMAYVPVVGPKPPHHRITMSYSTITAARQVWVLISGSGKGKAFRETVTEGTTPLGRVLSSRTHSLVFNDIC